MAGAGRRLVFAGLVLAVLPGCVKVTSDVNPRDTPITATAYSKVDGVETWDLTGRPSDAAFGIGGSRRGIYQTDEPRPVRFLLPGRTVETTAIVIAFRGSRGDYSFGLRTDSMKLGPLVAEFRDVLGQLDIDDTMADTFAQESAAAPRDQSESIETGTGARGAVMFGQWRVGPAVGYTPLADLGSMTFSGYSVPSP